MKPSKVPPSPRAPPMVPKTSHKRQQLERQEELRRAPAGSLISAGSSEFPAMDPMPNPSKPIDQYMAGPSNSSSGAQGNESSKSTTGLHSDQEIHKLIDGMLVKAIVCGWPERSASLVARALTEAGVEVLDFGFALREENGITLQPQIQIPELGSRTIHLVANSRDDLFKDRLASAIPDLNKSGSKSFLVVIDTSPNGADKARLYAECGLGFVVTSSHPEDTIKVAGRNIKAPAVVLERTSPALSVLDHAYLAASNDFPGVLQGYKLSYNRSSATLQPLLSSNLMEALQNLVARPLNREELLAKASEHPIATEADTVEELVLENECSKLKITFVRKERANDEEFAFVAVKAVKYLAVKYLADKKLRPNDAGQSSSIGGSSVYSLADVLRQQSKSRLQDLGVAS